MANNTIAFSGNNSQGAQIGLNSGSITNTFHVSSHDPLSKLPFAEGAAIYSYSRQYEPSCLENTRADLLQQLREWSNDPNGKCIFWLNGMAGTGKSTIARTVARESSNQNRLGASFFFSRGGGSRSHARMFFSTIALQLAGESPDLKRFICKSVDENPDIVQRSLSDQWQKLVFQPLSRLSGVQVLPPTLLVIDALDECENQNDVRLILRLLAAARDLQQTQLRVFVTSRPEFPILTEFKAIPTTAHQDFILHNISKSVVEHDISSFVKTELAQIRSEHELSMEWPSEHVINTLVQRSCGLFIYVATICRFISESKHPERCLTRIIRCNWTNHGPEQNLDKIYTQILRDSLGSPDDPDERDELLEIFRQTLGSIVVLFDLLSITALRKLLSIQIRDVEAVVFHLRSILDLPYHEQSPIKLLHPSFRDFLLDSRRCQDKQFWIDKGKAHGDLWKSCLQLMSVTLKRDICKVGQPGTLVKDIDKKTITQCLPSHVQYACRYWVKHLQEFWKYEREKAAIYREVHKFLRKDFLHWLEALSLIGSISDGILMILDLESLLAPSKTVFQSDLIQDAKRFVLHNRPIIEIAPLQLYVSAIMFSPEMSLIRQLYFTQGPSWVELWPVVDKNWSPTIQILEGHSSSVSAVAFSPDGHRLASGSGDCTVRLWDAVTGAQQQTLEGHSSYVRAIAFSLDGRRLASSSDDNTVRLWDADTGALQHTLEGHSSYVSAIAFTPNGRRLASGSGDCTVRLWNADTGTLQQTLKGHSSSIIVVNFSPNGQQLASGSSDCTLHLWDADTGALQQTFKGHISNVRAFAFSPDGRRLASSPDNYSDYTVRLWDANASTMQELKGHSSYVSAVVFSPDGRRLVSSSGDRTLRLWDADIGILKSTLEGHSSYINAVAFSPDGQRLASGSGDCTVRLWDAHIVTQQQSLKGYSSHVKAIAFSLDGRRLASGSDDYTVRLWDADTGALQQTLQGHSSYVRAVAFSPDGQRLASGSWDCTVRLWDANTGALQQTLKGHSSNIKAIAFSPDGQRLASGSGDCTVRLWDVNIGALQQTLEGHSSYVSTVTFSPDGRRLASGSDDYTVRLWDADTGALQQTLKGYSSFVSAVAFSPDGQRLASSSYDWTVRLWDANTGALQQTLTSSSIITEMSFTSNWMLNTDIGQFELGREKSILSPVQELLWSLYSFDSTGSWVALKGNNVLWLPPEYRRSRRVFRNNVIAFGCESGRVSIIRFQTTIKE